MRSASLLLVAILLLCGCERSYKTYFPDGRIKSQCALDNEGRRNGVYQEYDSLGNLWVETDIHHDTLSGLVKDYYIENGHLHILVRYSPILYKDSIDAMFLLRDIDKITNIETYVYDRNDKLSKYVRDFSNRKKTLLVKYTNDSICEIWGEPYVPWKQIKKFDDGFDVSFTVSRIPKCAVSFSLLDSAGNVLHGCKNCNELTEHIQNRKSYSVQVEYADSQYHIRYSIVRQYGSINTFSKDFQREWKREDPNQ